MQVLINVYRGFRRSVADEADAQCAEILAKRVLSLTCYKCVRLHIIEYTDGPHDASQILHAMVLVASNLRPHARGS